MILGIDLGTTNSVAAYMAEDGPRLIPNSLGEFLTPSVIGLDHTGELLVGRSAVELQVSQPTRCAGLFKRHMGSKHEFQLAQQVFTAEILSSLVLKSLKADAEALTGESVHKAVITVPAYFNDHQRKATMQAGKLAGLEVVRILNEPTAAAIAYGLHDTGASKIIAIFDLGGGTFDISLVELFEGSIEVRASSGECFLGGEDFTRTLAARVLERQGLVFERVEMTSPQLISRLIQQCERAKRQLTSRDHAEIRVPDMLGQISDQSPLATISRQDFQQFTESILGRIELPIRRCLGDAKLTRADIKEVILVGGATRMPAVVERVAELFQKEPQHRLNPDEVVALGAAVQAGLIERNRSLEELVVTDVCPFTLGVAISKQFGQEHRGGYFLSIIHRNTTIPVSRVEQVCTVHAGQTQVQVKVYQGDGRRVEDNILLGEFTVNGIPSGKPGQAIDIRFTYDLNGVLEAEATVVATKAKATLVITRYAGELSQVEINAAVEQMAALKHHPREDAANRFLLKRAERVFQELPRDQRDFLGQMLDAFETLLDRQEHASAITELRLEITSFLDRFDPPDLQDEER